MLKEQVQQNKTKRNNAHRLLTLIQINTDRHANNKTLKPLSQLMELAVIYLETAFTLHSNPNPRKFRNLT